jgi:hypothetical protein
MRLLSQNTIKRKRIFIPERRLALAAVVTMCVASVCGATTRSCPQKNAAREMSEASTLKTWSEVFNSYKKYKQCDDGAIAEGYSASIASLLASHWTDVDQLIKLTNADQNFRQFVIKHVDETMSPDQGKSIKDSASNNCPANGKRLCVAIQKRFAELGFPG